MQCKNREILTAIIDSISIYIHLHILQIYFMTSINNPIITHIGIYLNVVY